MQDEPNQQSYLDQFAIVIAGRFAEQSICDQRVQGIQFLDNRIRRLCNALNVNED